MDFSKYSSDLLEDDQYSSDVLGIERLEQQAILQARDFLNKRDSPKDKNLLNEIKQSSSELLLAYYSLVEDLTSQSLTPASEWFLDNFHIIEEQIRSIKRDLPKNFYDELIKIKGGNYAGYPRVFAIAHNYINHTDSRLDLASIKKYVQAFQTVSPLTIGELWAIAITLRISLIKRLHPLVDSIIQARKNREEADRLADRLLELATKSETKSEQLIEVLSQSIERMNHFTRPFAVQLIQRLRDQDPIISKAYDWLEEFLQGCKSSTSDIVKLEHLRQASAQVTIGNIISSMRLISKIDWHDFFEEVSLVDPVLKQDPSHSFDTMDRATKDSYRKAIERISKHSSHSEVEVAQKALTLASEVSLCDTRVKREMHIGYYLIDQGVFKLENLLGYRSPFKEILIRFIDEDPTYIYFGLLFLFYILFTTLIINFFEIKGPLYVIGIIVLTAIPISELSVSLLNYIITLMRRPKRLPRMNTDKGISSDDTTMVVVPCLLSNQSTIQELLSNLEVQFLANQDPHIYFALLGDLADSIAEVETIDQELLESASRGIETLNERYKKQYGRKFYLFHRKRVFNPSEGKWMGWERKRGKIVEFNQLLRGSKKTTYIGEEIDIHLLKQIKYVITLDADTQLPLQSARKLIGTIIHPLNLPVYEEKTNRIVAGYGILQPRISVSILSASKSRFSKIFSGDTGIDPYTNAVSDVYQDLFNEGSFTGKGLYVVDAFEKVVGNRIPENRVLSHDLLEGSYARVGLTTDLELIDDFPSNFEIYMKRLHRWTRGDWQIALWLFPYVLSSDDKWVRNNLPFIARWKIFDNLRRSLLSLNLLLWLAISWIFFKGNELSWTIAIIIIASFPVYVTSFRDMLKFQENAWKEHFTISFKDFKHRLWQFYLMLVFLPSMATDQIDAIIRALYRMIFSKKNLLEWTTFSQTQKNITSSKEKLGRKELLSSGPVLGTMIILGILLINPHSIFIAAPFLISWYFAPIALRWTKSKTIPKFRILDKHHHEPYRRYARLTWHFFETFVNEKNNWLAPDNFQEDPSPVVAHRTSPTNIGLQLLSTISAYDLGYLGVRQLIDLLEKTIGSLTKLEKHKGHLFNWYETLQLQPLSPRYVSTVDSGNLAGHLITLRQALLKLCTGPYINPHRISGMKDSLMSLITEFEQFQKKYKSINAENYRNILQSLNDTLILAEKEMWINIIDGLSKVQQEIQTFSNTNSHLSHWVEKVLGQAHAFHNDETIGHHDLVERLTKMSDTCQEFYLSMDFAFLYDEERKIFSIGHNVTESRRDDSYYDLLASESRLASFIAIAKGDIPEEHWFRLGRQITTVTGGRVLISWSASMFEYLMPLLVMRRYDDTLLDQTYDSVVARQIEYGQQRSIPWGVSEAGYNARDLQFNYQYGPFGIPGLGLKRGLRDELVISPYSTMLASMVFPKDSLNNLQRLEKMEALGKFGFYESIDYTQARLPKGKPYTILTSYMAHHQGMSLISINNILNRNIMQRRFHADPRMKAVQLLLQEKVPTIVQTTKPRAEETHIENYARFTQNHHTRIYSDPSLSTPRTQIISNGNYSLMMTSSGSGYTQCDGRMLTRWKEDPTMDNWGQFFYIKNLSKQKIWSIGARPIESKPSFYEAHFSEDKIEILREDYQIASHLEAIVSSEDNAELRRLSFTNKSSETVDLEVTSYMEIVLSQARDDDAHPAFSKLFIQTEYLPDATALIARRRPRSQGETIVYGFHTLIADDQLEEAVQFETDRSKFIGRGRSVHDPIGLESNLSQTVGAVLDPIFSLRTIIRLRPEQTTRLTFTTGLAYSIEETHRLIEKYRDPNIFLRQINLGWVKGQISLRHMNISLEKAHMYQRLAGRILYLAPYLRAQSQLLMANRKHQEALWGYGISGDLPIVLTRISDEKDMEMVRELLRGQEYLRLKGLRMDLVILNEHATSYLQNLQDELMRQILISGFHSFLDKPGGIFIRRADLMPKDDLILLMSVARISLFANKGPLTDQLRRRPLEKELPKKFIPTREKKEYPVSPIPEQELLFFNGQGGFSRDGQEYIINLKNNKWTPAPWINVIGNKVNFGFLISESGSGYTWSVNSRENRLSTWSNDFVADPPSEVIYIRDEETGKFWTPTPLPVREATEYQIKHGQGYSQFLHVSQGISQQMTVFAPIDRSVKIIQLRLKNLTEVQRRITVTPYIDWVLGFSKTSGPQMLSTKWDDQSGALFAKNSYNNEFSERISFLYVDGNQLTFTADRKEFIGRNKTMRNPTALQRQDLSGKTGGGFDLCGAIQSKFTFSASEEKEIIILLGQGQDENEARELISTYKLKSNSDRALLNVKKYWHDILNTIQVETPEVSLDLMVNKWLLYQTLSCRIWARSAFYQSGGAFGFRDQLQDVMALVYADPGITRSQIELASSRQFPEGDVQHWWHPPTGRGVRTRFSDDLLWLPLVVAHYIQITGDYSILDKEIPFIEAPLLTEGHDETYTQPKLSQEKTSIYNHCLRAIERSLQLGTHGLPLMGSGDWNDGMNRVGHQGKGESVWLAWFILKILKDFIPICIKKNDLNLSDKYCLHINELKKNIETNGWDGEWYLRAYFDNGEKLGSKSNEECKIDSIAQSWSLLSGEGDLARSKEALEAVNEFLINMDEGIIKLFAPPFDKSSADPGYIKGYVPGVRENGGQYTHAAIWTTMAFAALNDGNKAMELFRLINPINRTTSMAEVEKYKVEPYVLAADIYGVDPHVGRGGWSWYTGSASWMYRAAIESLLGFHLYPDGFEIQPCIPKDWTQFQITYRRDKTIFYIKVFNQQATSSIELDGEIIENRRIPLIEDGKEHFINVKLKATVQ